MLLLSRSLGSVANHHQPDTMVIPRGIISKVIPAHQESDDVSHDKKPNGARVMTIQTKKGQDGKTYTL